MVRVLGFHVAAGVSSLEDLKREKLNILLGVIEREIVWREMVKRMKWKGNEEESETLIDSRDTRI